MTRSCSRGRDECPTGARFLPSCAHDGVFAVRRPPPISLPCSRGRRGRRATQGIYCPDHVISLRHTPIAHAPSRDRRRLSGGAVLEPVHRAHAVGHAKLRLFARRRAHLHLGRRSHVDRPQARAFGDVLAALPAHRGISVRGHRGAHQPGGGPCRHARAGHRSEHRELSVADAHRGAVRPHAPHPRDQCAHRSRCGRRHGGCCQRHRRRCGFVVRVDCGERFVVARSLRAGADGCHRVVVLLGVLAEFVKGPRRSDVVLHGGCGVHVGAVLRCGVPGSPPRARLFRAPSRLSRPPASSPPAIRAGTSV